MYFLWSESNNPLLLNLPFKIMIYFIFCLLLQVFKPCLNFPLHIEQQHQQKANRIEVWNYIYLYEYM